MITALLIWLGVLILAIVNICFVISLERRLRRLERLDKKQCKPNPRPPHEIVGKPHPRTFKG